MWRWIAISLTSLAVLIGLWGAYEWSRSGPPPLGDITLESVTPPETELSVNPQHYCDKAVPGFWATGTSTMQPKDVSAWFDSRFGQRNEEATARLSTRFGNSVVYADVATMVRREDSQTAVWVLTYETISHHCLKRSLDHWDDKNAATFLDACDKLIIDFWGVEYGADIVENPPGDASTIDFEDGRAIAHSAAEPEFIHARTGPDSEWRRYVTDNGCFVD